MSTKKTGLPSEQTLVKLMVESARHAEEYLDSTRILLEAERWPKALSLATLAFEELGKANLCMSVLMTPPRDQTAREQYGKTFGKIFTGHASKLALAYLAFTLVVSDTPPPTVAQVSAEGESWANVANEAKFRSLYVDYEHDGTLLTPADVTETDARWMAERAAALLEGMRWMTELADAPLDDFLDVLHDWQDGVDLDAVYASFTQDPDVFIDMVRGAIHGTISPPKLLQGGIDLS